MNKHSRLRETSKNRRHCITQHFASPPLLTQPQHTRCHTHKHTLGLSFEILQETHILQLPNTHIRANNKMPKEANAAHTRSAGTTKVSVVWWRGPLPSPLHHSAFTLALQPQHQLAPIPLRQTFKISPPLTPSLPHLLPVPLPYHTPPPPRKTLVKGKVDLLPLNTWGPAAVLGQEPPILLIINNYQAPPPSTGAYAAASSPPPPPPNPSLFPISRPRSSRAEEKTCSKNVYGCVDVRPRCHCLQRVTCVREA